MEINYIWFLLRGIDKDSIKLFVFEYFVFVVFMLGICIGVGINYYFGKIYS